MSTGRNAPAQNSQTVIPLIDMRAKTLPDLVRAKPDDARALIHGVADSYGVISKAATALLLPGFDRRSHALLKRTNNPYLGEIDQFAKAIDMKGAYAFNACYEWACTTGAYATGNGVTLLRVLDWGFPNLGARVLVLRQSSKHGEFFNITWPAFAGTVNAMAPGRFAAAINIAPERRHRLTRAGDWLKNKRIVKGEQGLPAAHLLRKTFEEAADYDAAKEMLSKTKVLSPVIFTLTGVKPGQGCIIERTENSAGIHELAQNPRVSTANHFRSHLIHEGKGWRARGVNSHDRFAQSCTITPAMAATANFAWLKAPIINWETRLAVQADAAAGTLRVQGFAGDQRVTELFELPALATLPK